jgi:hypothetical protein
MRKRRPKCKATHVTLETGCMAESQREAPGRQRRGNIAVRIRNQATGKTDGACDHQMVRLGRIRAMAGHRWCGGKKAAGADRPAETRRKTDFVPKVTHALRKNHELRSVREHGTDVDDAAP